MKKLIMILLLCLIVSSASAGIDPDPNILGIYFDTDAFSRCITIPPSVAFFTYLILTNPTPASINAYEMGLEIEVPAGMEGMFFQLANNIGNGAVPGLDVGENGALGGDYIVGLASPIPSQPATILHSWQHMLLAVFPAYFILGASSVPSIPGDYPVVQDADGSVLMQVGVVFGPGNYVAGVNDALLCEFAVEEVSFGRIKSLYR